MSVMPFDYSILKLTIYFLLTTNDTMVQILVLFISGQFKMFKNVEAYRLCPGCSSPGIESRPGALC